MKTLLLITLLSVNNPKDTTKKKSCCNQNSHKNCLNLSPNDSIKQILEKKEIRKKKKK